MINQEVTESIIGISAANSMGGMPAIENPKSVRFGKIQKKLKTVIDKLKIGYP